jgi:hypothetical protein
MDKSNLFKHAVLIFVDKDSGEPVMAKGTADGKLLVDAVIEVGDIEIGAVEIKSGKTGDEGRAYVEDIFGQSVKGMLIKSKEPITPVQWNKDITGGEDWDSHSFGDDPTRLVMIKARGENEILLTWGDGTSYITIPIGGVYTVEANVSGKTAKFKCAENEVVEIEIWK